MSFKLSINVNQTMKRRRQKRKQHATRMNLVGLVNDICLNNVKTSESHLLCEGTIHK